MPTQGPGLRHDTTATKAVLHGDPVVENNYIGIAFKNTQLTAFIDPLTTAARQIAVGEQFTVVLEGMTEVRSALVPGGLAITPGTALYISGADNTLATSGSPSEGTDEIQTVTVTGAPTGGSFTLTFSGQTTAAIAYNATAATVQAALEALSNINPGDVAVTGAAGGVWSVTFTGQYADVNVPAMTHTDSLTGGTSPAVAVATGTSGASGVFKFGLVDGSSTQKGVVRVNTNARDMF